MNDGGGFLVDGSHELLESQVRQGPVQSVAGVVVHKVSNKSQRTPVMHAQIRALEQEPALQALGVLAVVPLTGTVRVARLHSDPGGLGQLRVTVHRLVLVEGERLARGCCYVVELAGKSRQRRCGSGLRHHPAQQHQACGAFQLLTH